MRWPTWRAITWSIETPARMSVALFLRRTPVRNVPLPRAWSPAPSGPPVGRLVVQAAEDLDQALERLQRLEACGLSWKSVPSPLGPPGGGDGAVGEVDEGRPQAGRPWRSSPGRRPRPLGGEQPGVGRSDANAGSATQAPRPAEEPAAAEARAASGGDRIDPVGS